MPIDPQTRTAFRIVACLASLALLMILLAAPAAAQQPAPQPAVVAYGAPQPVYAAPIRRGFHWLFAPRAWAQPTMAVFPAPPQPPQAVYCPTCRQYHVRR